MATIRKKGDYQWHVQIRRKGYPTQTKTLETKVAAETWAREIEGEMDKGVFISRAEAERTTLREVLERYEREVTPSKKGAAKEKSVIKKLLADPLSARFMATIRGADIAALRDDRLKDYAPKTVVNELALLSNVFNIARREWGMESLLNPIGMVSKPRIKNARDRRLTEDELDKIVANTGSRELPAIIRLLTETAMRRGELSKLRWEHIDLKDRVATLYDTKNSEDRVVPLSRRAVSALTSLPRRNDGKVFGMTPDAITKAFSRACKRLGIEDACIHDLRHEATSRLFEKGTLDVMEVATITGHKTLQMLKRYTHLKAKDMVRKLD